MRQRLFKDKKGFMSLVVLLLTCGIILLLAYYQMNRYYDQGARENKEMKFLNGVLDNRDPHEIAVGVEKRLKSANDLYQSRVKEEMDKYQ